MWYDNLVKHAKYVRDLSVWLKNVPSHLHDVLLANHGYFFFFNKVPSIPSKKKIKINILFYFKLFETFGNIILGKLQTTSLKFVGVWILHPRVSKFEFYLLKFVGVWILHLNVSEFEFYLSKFGAT